MHCLAAVQRHVGFCPLGRAARNASSAPGTGLGIKPFYYTMADGSFLFASEIKALLAHPDAGKRPDDPTSWHLSRMGSVSTIPKRRCLKESSSWSPPTAMVVTADGPQAAVPVLGRDGQSCDPLRKSLTTRQHPASRNPPRSRPGSTSEAMSRSAPASPGASTPRRSRCSSTISSGTRPPPVSGHGRRPSPRSSPTSGLTRAGISTRSWPQPGSMPTGSNRHRNSSGTISTGWCGSRTSRSARSQSMPSTCVMRLAQGEREGGAGRAGSG